jgi:hypothetical protein
MTTYTFIFSNGSAPNGASTTLAGSISNSATSLAVAAGTGMFFPSPTAGQAFALSLTSASNAAYEEIVYCTARSVDIFTIVRAQEGTTALSFNAGDLAVNTITAGVLGSYAQSANLYGYTSGYGADTGTTNAMVVTLSPVPANFAALLGALIRVLVLNTISGPTTINPNGLGVTGVVNPDGTQLAAGQLKAGMIATLVSDGTHFQLQSITGAPGPIFPPMFLTGPGAYSVTTPYGAVKATATCVGGGGGGAGGSTTQAGGGGGGGCVGIFHVTGLVGGTTVISGSVAALGTGGASGANAGNPGGNTTLVVGGVTLGTMNGGQGGGTTATPSGGQGGTFTPGTPPALYITFPGSDGTDGSPGTNTYGGNGAPGYLGAGAGRGGEAGGQGAMSYGAGGGGSYSTTAGAGGGGNQGLVIIEFSAA